MSSHAGALPIGEPIRVVKIQSTRIIFTTKSGGEYSTELDNVEPVGSCLPDPKKQFDFIAMHSAVISFVNPKRDTQGADLPASSELTDDQHFTHTFNSMLLAARRYGKDTVTLLYYYGASATCILAFSHAGIIAYATSPTPRSTLEAMVDQYLKAASSGADVRELSKQLSAVLMPKDLERKLGEFSNLIVVPYGVIALVPFAAIELQEAKLPLIAKFAYTVAPAFTQVGIGRGIHTAKNPDGSKLRSVVIGNPAFADKQFVFYKLPKAEKEAIEVAKKLGVTPVLRYNATLEKVAEAIRAVQGNDGRFDILYLATHGYADRNPGWYSASFLALADGQRLSKTTINAIGYAGSRLVVLSACQTGTGWVDEVGAIGLPVLFHQSGADEVVMSLWNVDDASTAYLMEQFLSEYARRWPLASAASSLKVAVTKTREKFPATRDWAAFSTYGVGPF